MKFYLPFCYLIIIFFCAGRSYAGSDHNELDAARKCRDKGMFDEAGEHYKKFLSQSPTASEVNTEYAEMLFFEMRDYEAAYPYLKKVLTYEPDTIVYYYAVAKIEHFHENYDLAGKMYKALADNVRDDKETHWVIEDAKRGIEQINYCLQHKGEIVSAYLRVVNLGDHVNSRYAEYVPVVDEREDFIMFTSRRKNQFNQYPDVEDDRYHEDMYMSKRKGPVFDTAVPMPYQYKEIGDVQNSSENESLVSLSPDGKTLFIYKAGTLWKSTYDAGHWTEPVKLEKEIIAKDYANHVTMTGDGNAIFFTSEKKGGAGKLDIYTSTKKSDGSWSTPENLGKLINTSGNEQSPFISKDGKTLYFSSDALPGFGGYDIYKSTFDGTKWSQPENLGVPFNSPSDDVFFYPKQDGTEGFFSSNRKGGIGNFDIYRYYYIDKADFDNHDYVVKDKDETLDLSNKSATQWIDETSKSDATEKLHFRINDTLVTSDAALVKNYIKEGAVKKLDVEQINKCDTCVYKSTNYYTIANPVAEPETTLVAVNNKDTTLVKPNFSETNNIKESYAIYFDFNSTQMKDRSDKEISKLITSLLENKNYKIQIVGYTDPIGSAGYNKKLSSKRARSVAAYLKKNNIPSAQISSVKGDGILIPKVRCATPECAKEQNALCRKVEIIISNTK